MSVERESSISKKSYGVANEICYAFTRFELTMMSFEKNIQH